MQHPLLRNFWLFSYKQAIYLSYINLLSSSSLKSLVNNGLWFVKLTMNENIAWIFSGLVSVVRKVWSNLVEKAGEEQQLLEKNRKSGEREQSNGNGKVAGWT